MHRTPLHIWQRQTHALIYLIALQEGPCVAYDDHPAGHGPFLKNVLPSLGRGLYPGDVAKGIKKDEGVKKDAWHWCELAKEMLCQGHALADVFMKALFATVFVINQVPSRLVYFLLVTCPCLLFVGDPSRRLAHMPHGCLSVWCRGVHKVRVQGSCTIMGTLTIPLLLCWLFPPCCRQPWRHGRVIQRRQATSRALAMCSRTSRHLGFYDQVSRT